MCDKHFRYFKSTPRNMRSCSSAGKWWVARSGWELVPQARKFKYLRVLFMRGEKMEQERWTVGLGRPLLKCRCFTGLLWCSWVQPRGKAFDLLVCLRSDLTCGHELWVVTVWTRSQIQAVEMRFLQRVTRLSLRDTVRSSNVQRELWAESLLLGVKKT